MRLRNASLLAVVTFAFAGGLFVSPTSADHLPLVDVSLGASYVSDFNADDGGLVPSAVPPPPPRPDPASPSWEHGALVRPAAANPSWEWGEFENGVRPPPAASSWQWGAPTSGPGVAVSGSNVWATNLAGTYNTNECGALLSPPIDLTAASSASFSFMQWRHFERSSATGTIFDGGRLYVTSDGGATLSALSAPTPAYDTGTLSSVAASCFNGMPTTGSGAYAGPVGTALPPPTFSSVGADLTAFAGTTVRVVVAFGSDGSVVRSGWYLDDFAVTVNGVTTVEDFEASDGGFAIVTSAPAPPNGPGVAFSGTKAWGTNLGGQYNNLECDAIMSPSISIPPATTASVSFMQWRHFERSTATGTILDGGRLFVTGDGGTTLTRLDSPVPAYDVGTLNTDVATCLNGVPTTGTNAYAGPAGTALPPPTYSSVGADLSTFAGQSVQFVIAFASGTSTVRSGWYVDDFAVTIGGVTTVEDFEGSDGGFTVLGTRPATGPGAAFSGTHVWATNLEGNYNSNECDAIASPPIDLPPEATAASFAFMQWHHFERLSTTGTIFDAGRLFVTADGGESFTSLDAPTPAYDAGTLSTTAATCLNGLATSAGGYGGPVGTTLPPPSYSAVGADLGAFIGNTVQVVVAFGSESGGERNGWYLDDFAVTIDGVTTTEDFEAGDGGFTVMTTSVGPAQPKGWSWGQPTTGPGGVGEGDNLWATNLGGNYGPNECATLETPPLDLTGLADPVAQEANLTGFPATQATLRWQNWFRGSTTGAGVIQVGTEDGNYTAIRPKSGYGTSTPSSTLAACLGTSGSGSAFASAVSAVGDPLVDLEADLTPFLGHVVTVRFVLASTSSATTNLGWYVDNVEVERTLYVGEPHAPDLPLLGANDAPLWTQGGESSSWAYGVVTDPSANAGAMRGQTGYKTNLAGNSNLGECSWIASPAIPGALLGADPTLEFEHAYRIPGASVDVAWGGGLVQASTDGGLTWAYLDLPEYDRPLNYTGGDPECFTGLGAPIEGRVFSGVHTDLETVTVDLSAFAGAPTVQVRFVFGTAVFAYEGWFLNRVEVGGVELMS